MTIIRRISLFTIDVVGIGVVVIVVCARFLHTAKQNIQLQCIFMVGLAVWFRCACIYELAIAYTFPQKKKLVNVSIYMLLITTRVIRSLSFWCMKNWIVFIEIWSNWIPSKTYAPLFKGKYVVPTATILFPQCWWISTCLPIWRWITEKSTCS